MLNWTAFVQVVVNSNEDVGRSTSLTVVNGNPSISYYEIINGDLKYWRLEEIPEENSVAIPVLNDWGMIVPFFLITGIAIGGIPRKRASK